MHSYHPRNKVFWSKCTLFQFNFNIYIIRWMEMCATGARTATEIINWHQWTIIVWARISWPRLLEGIIVIVLISSRWIMQFESWIPIDHFFQKSHTIWKFFAYQIKFHVWFSYFFYKLSFTQALVTSFTNRI